MAEAELKSSGKKAEWLLGGTSPTITLSPDPDDFPSLTERISNKSSRISVSCPHILNIESSMVSSKQVATRVIEVGFCFEEELSYENLMNTFEQTLEYFPPVLARLELSKKGLNCSNQGCILEVIWSGELPPVSQIFDNELFTPIHKEDILKSGGPLSHFRITFAPERTYIGVSWSHVIGDMRSLHYFMSTWACLYNGSEVSDIFCHERERIFGSKYTLTTKPLTPKEFSAWAAEKFTSEPYKPDPPVTIMKIKCDHEMLSTLWDEIAEISETDIKMSDVLIAFIWLQVMDIEPRLAFIWYIADISNWIPEKFFGNALVPVCPPLPFSRSVPSLAESIRKSLDSLDHNYLHFVNTLEDAKPRVSGFIVHNWLKLGPIAFGESPSSFVPSCGFWDKRKRTRPCVFIVKEPDGCVGAYTMFSEKISKELRERTCPFGPFEVLEKFVWDPNKSKKKSKKSGSTPSSGRQSPFSSFFGHAAKPRWMKTYE